MNTSSRCARGPISVPLLGALALGVHASFFAGYVIDDAWISFRYARNLASGLGLVFDPGGPPVEGYTNFLWVMLAAPFIGAGIPVAKAMAIIGLLCAMALVALATARARQDDHGVPLAGVPTALVLASAHGLAFHAVAGLETPLFSLLILAGALALIDRRPAHFASFTSLAFLTRPEAALLGIVGTGLLLTGHGDRDARRRDALKALSFFVLLVTPYLAFKIAYFGKLLPNTWDAKSPDFWAGARYAGRELGPYAALVAAALTSARARLKERNHGHATLVLIALMFATAAACVGGDWMPGARMLVPTLAPLAIAADRPIRSLLRPTRAHAGALRSIAALSFIAIFPWQIARSIELVRGTEARVPIDAERIQFAEHISHRGIRSVALFDIGLVAYAAPHVHVIDLAGLTDPTIANLPGHHGEKEADFDYLESLAPDLVVLTSGHAAARTSDGRVRVQARFAAEQHIETSDWLAEHYAYTQTLTASDVYRMHVFERRQRSIP